MEEFKNYKEKQNYYKELYKNRGKIFFAQRPGGYAFDKVTGKRILVRSKKGRTYVKDESEVK